ncbi:MAG TPA: hypothetical protein VLI39_18365 [Sedimentisphaerales bacterium]|nr:hypothetical protein [Sedimentisphaerales bacterium]
MTRRRWTILLGAIILGTGLLWAFLVHDPVEEGRCRLVRRKADPDSQLMGLAFRFIEPLGGKPDIVEDLPADFERPGYYQIKSGDRLIPVAVDYSKDLHLCIDADGDGILSEERCFTAKSVKATRISSSSHRFGPISPVSSDGGKADDGFYVNCYRTDAPALLITCSAFFRTGKLRLAGQTYRVAVVDGDYDGSYHSVLSLPVDRPWRQPGSDVFAIDLNRNGKFEISMALRSEVVPLGRLVQVDDAYYAIDIAPDGTSLTLSRTEPQFGTLVVEPNDADVRLRLWSDAADQHLPSGRQWQLPAGRYKAIDAFIKKTDASGDVWTFSSDSSSGSTHLGPLDFFEIKPGETTSVRIGLPFVVKADVQRAGSGIVSIRPVLVGCADEEYQANFRRNYRRPPERTFKIVDEKGTVLETGKFEYG